MSINKLTDISKSKWITIGELFFLIFLVFYGLKMHRDNMVHQVIIDETKLINQSVSYDIDNIEETWTQDQKYITISGWFVEKYADLKKNREKVVVLLKDKATDTYYQLPTTMFKRTDITDKLYDGTDYTRSGFTAHVRCNVAIDLDQQDYELCLYAKTKSGSQLFDLGTGVNQWIEEHQ